MSLLEAHLKEIELCSSTISDLPFPPPKIFTNALLRTQDITALIRDTEAHERALFSLAPSSEILESSEGGSKRKGNDKYRNPTRSTAVAAVLGGDMAERLRREKAGETRSLRRATGMPKDDLDVEYLLRGAEKLCAVYLIQGAQEKIAVLRNRHEKVKSSLDHYEGLVAEQASQLRQMNRPSSRMSEYEDDDDLLGGPGSEADAHAPLTAEDLRREEETVRELEQKKQTLEDRVSGMEKDLGGILR